MNTIKETEKLIAAMDVSDSGILTGKQKYSDIQRVKAILPEHYEVKESKSPNAIHCVSKTGIRKDIDAEDDEHWSYIFSAFKKHFGDRFKEVFHNVCFCHTDFTIYVKNTNLMFKNKNMNKGILKKTEAGWFVLYQVMRDEITSGYDSIPLHPDSQTWMDGYNLYEGKEVEFEVRVYPSGSRFAKTIGEDDLGCSYPDCICQGNEITDCKNRTPDQVVLGDKTALDEDVFHQGHKKLSFRERCRVGNYTPFNIENLMGELSKKKKEPYITQEEFEEFHNTIMDGLKIPRHEQ